MTLSKSYKLVLGIDMRLRSRAVPEKLRRLSLWHLFTFYSMLLSSISDFFTHFRYHMGHRITLCSVKRHSVASMEVRELQTYLPMGRRAFPAVERRHKRHQSSDALTEWHLTFSNCIKNIQRSQITLVSAKTLPHSDGKLDPVQILWQHSGWSSGRSW